ncbi:MAG: hypothetical protein GY747_07835 [Planctomycetes bacterium]|nr:hypothetical protein [Planctomycetota bacterium]MCP4770748.1 hypothetical protein [Planctomycetota bacterium]MCP4862181.1 hypothetical protein [Planctomycetota bacterium]
MRTTQLLLALCLFFAPLAMTAPASAQNDNPPNVEADFLLKRIQSEHVFIEELYDTLESMYGRELEFEDRIVNNLALLEESVVIYETAERMQRIMDAVTQLDIDLHEQSVDQHGEDEEETSIDPFELVLESYMPKYLDSTELYRIATELYSREIKVNDDWHQNLSLTSSGLLIHDVRDPALDLLARLKELDESQAPSGQGEIVATQYQPRHLSAYSLMEGLSPFRTSVPDRLNPRSSTVNISVMNERGILVIRDYKDRVAEILTTLEALDQPAPQVMVVCQVLHGVRGDATRPAADDLQEQLRGLLPYESYHVDSNGMLRGSAVSGTNMEIKMQSSQHEYRLKMSVGAYDAKTGALDLSRCELTKFDMQHGDQQLFNTSATIYKGEYAVLGVTGAEPLFLVVQLHPVKGSH